VTIAPTPSSAGVVARLTDGDPYAQWTGAVGSVTLDVDLGTSPPAVSGWGMLHHNLSGVTVTLASGTSFPPGTTRDSLDPAGADLFRSFAAVTARYWRVTLPALSGSLAPLIGELVFGTSRTIDEPGLPTGWPTIVGNVARDRSPAGVPWTTRRGSSRVRLPVEWQGMPEADLVSYFAAYADCGEGEQPVLLQLEDGVARFMTWTDTELSPEALGNGLFHVRSTFEGFPS